MSNIPINNKDILFTLLIVTMCGGVIKQLNTAINCTVLFCKMITILYEYCTAIFGVLYCTVLYCTVLYCIVLYSTLSFCTVSYCTYGF